MIVICYLERDNDNVLTHYVITLLTLKKALPSFKCHPLTTLKLWNQISGGGVREIRYLDFYI